MDRTLDFLKNFRRGHVLLMLLFIAMYVSAKDADRWTNPNAQRSAMQPRNYVEKNFGIPGDTISNKKKGPKKAWTDTDPYSDTCGDTYYGIILDGKRYYYVGEVTFNLYSNPPAIELDGGQSPILFLVHPTNA